MINSYKIGMRLLAVAAALTFGFGVSKAGDLVNSGTGQINNIGTIIFVSDTAAITNDNASVGAGNDIQNTGTIQFLGSDPISDGTNPLGSTDPLRFPGLVSYASPTNPQNLIVAYYTDLENIDGGAKNVPDQVYIGGDYTATGGTRTYTGTLYYDGTAAQSVAGETGANTYNNVELQNAGLKTLSADADVAGTFVFNANATGGFVVDGSTNANATITVTGNTKQDALAGDFTLNATGNAQLNGGTNDISGTFSANNGTLGLGDGTNASTTNINGALNLTSADGALNVSASGTMNIIGAATFTNADADRLNMTFASASTVDYQGTNNVITTAETNQYGNLIISSGNVLNPDNTTDGGTTAGNEDNVYVATGFTLNGGANFDMTTAGGGTDGFLGFTNATGNPVYGTDLEEVVGNFRRPHTMSASTDYVFNNEDMVINFDAVDASQTYFEVFVDPDGVADQYDDTRDVKRKITLNYDGTDWAANVTASYTDTDVDEDNAWIGGYAQDQIRFFEGNNTDVEKVSTGNTYTRADAVANTSFGTVNLGLFTPTTTDVDGTPDSDFLSTNDLILRAGPSIFYSVAHGRWSNPATWDEGIEPPTNAEVVVRHTVHAGFVRATDGYSVPEATPGAMATKITVQAANGTFSDPTLMFGTDGTTYPGAFATSTATVPGITDPGRLILEDPTAETVDAVTDFETTNDVSGSVFNAGLVLFNDATNGAPAFTVGENLINNSIISNAATLSIGQ